MVIYHNIHFVAVARSKVLVGGDNQISQRLSFLRCYARRSALLGLRPVDGYVVFISKAALQRLAPGIARHEEALLAAFDSNRLRIYQTAARIYGRGRLGISYDLTPADF